eukprot:3388929-Amphidinium_carterae.1
MELRAQKPLGKRERLRTHAGVERMLPVVTLPCLVDEFVDSQDPSPLQRSSMLFGASWAFWSIALRFRHFI